MILYNDVYEGLQSKGCTLLVTLEDFNKISNKTHTKLRVLSSCGHESSVQYCHFTNYGSGIYCKTCSAKKGGEKLKKIAVTNGMSTGHVIEEKAKQVLINKIKTNFLIKNVNDGLLVKPKDVGCDKWLKIQMKSVQKPAHIYSFHIKHINYENCLMALLCLSNEFVWLMPYSTVKDKRSISIGLTNSKYNKYLATSDEDTCNIVFHYYSTTFLFPINECMIPIARSHQLEYKYRLKRENTIDFIVFQQPQFEHMEYDFMIASTKHQEKIATELKQSSGIMLKLSRSNGSKKHKWYQLGECDFYWVWCKDTAVFYVFPENILLQHGLLSMEERKGQPSLCLYPHRSRQALESKNIKSTWTCDYKFYLENLDKEGLLLLLNIDSPVVE